MSTLITARALAEQLLPYGDLPVKLRTLAPDMPELDDVCCVTLLEQGTVSIYVKNKQQTDYGDLDVVLMDVIARDNA